MRNTLRDKVSERMEQKADLEAVYYGVLGNGNNVVVVPGRTNYVYVSLNDGSIVQAFNTLVPEIPNYPVVLGFSRRNPTLLCVLDQRKLPVTITTSTSVKTHHASHEWMNEQGGDVVYSQLRQIMPLRPTISSGSTIHIYRDFQSINGSWRSVGGLNVDITGARPVSGSGLYRYAMISLDTSTGSMVVTSGSTVTSGSALTTAFIPAAPAGNYPVCAVRLYSDQTQIVETRLFTELLDLRWGRSAVSGTGDHNLLAGLYGDSPYYHLDAAKYTVVQNTSGSNTGDQIVPSNHSSPAGQFVNGYSSGSFSSGSVAHDITKADTGEYYVTSGSSALANYRQLEAGNNITLDVSNANRIIVNATSGSSSGGGGGGIFWNVDGALASGSSLGQYVSTGALTLDKSWLYVRELGSSGSTICDVNINGVTIFTDQSKRPVIVWNSGSAVVQSGVPDVTAVVAGDVISWDIDEAATGAVDLAITVVGASGGATGGGHVIKYEGTPFAQRANLNFIGGLLVEDDAGNDATKVTVSTHDDGWIPAGETWTYSSADAPTYVFSYLDADTKLSAGMKLKYTQSGSTCFGITTAVSGSSVTFYGGTDYAMSGSAITNPYYSTQKAPYGFPLDPNKWTVEVTDVTRWTQATPATNTWYNLGSGALSISIPIGCWKTYYKCSQSAWDSATSETYSQVTLSTANNSESDVDFTCISYVLAKQVVINASVLKTLALTSKTEYYLNIRTTYSNIEEVILYNDWAKMIIRAECAYL